MDDGEARSPRQGRIVAAALLVGVGSAVAAVWAQRVPIARDFVDDALAARGVPARYEITRFGFRSQRIEHISIGDPAAPDLTADWAEIGISVGLGGASVRSIVARGVRLRGRLIDGKVSLGAVDRLLPASSGAPLALPSISVDLKDARMRLDTPAGVAGLALEGVGNLRDGFDGRLAGVMPAVAAGGCRAVRATAFVNLATADGKPTIDGPVRAMRIACPDAGMAVVAPRMALDLAFNEAMDRWDGDAVIETRAARIGGADMAMLGARIGLNGGMAAMNGDLSMFANGVVAPPGSARRVGIDGRYVARPSAGAVKLVGEAQLDQAKASAATLRRVSSSLEGADGTPIGPVARAIGEAAIRAGGDLDARATIALAARVHGGAIRVERIDANSRSGARLLLRSGVGRSGLSYVWPLGRSRIDGEMTLAGGGLPETRIALRQGRAGAPIEGEVHISPYSAGGARAAIDPIGFGPAPGGATRFATRITLDGPIGDGRVEGLSLPLVGRIGAGGAFLVNPGCAPLDFKALSVAGIALGRTRLSLCPRRGAMLFRSGGGALVGGVGIAEPRLTGRVGGSPLTIAARSLDVEIGKPAFRADAVAVRLGAGESVTRLDLARVAGDVSGRAVAGTFSGAAGQIGAVPLLLSDGAGDWRLAGGVLTLAGGLNVADADAAPRFNPLISKDVRLRLADGVVTAIGHLREPAGGVAIASVTLRHDLSAGAGAAVLDVPGVSFSKTLQPEMLTRLTLGVIANVSGAITGRGDIRWNARGVTSDGAFHSDGLDLAAAFGPVQRLSGEIRFTDLLRLETAPGQIALLGEVNPGVAVTGGEIRYQLLPGQRIKIESGRWPFSGGDLTLDETVLDMGKPSDRRLTFRVIGMDAAQFVQQFDFKNIAVTGAFDGVLPMIFDEKGGRIVGGRLVVRKGGGTLAYVGELSNEDLGMFGKLAFDALKSIRYDSLAIELDGALDGEIISKVLFDGVNEAPVDGKKNVGMLQNLTGLPFKFNITITAPFRGLINSAQSLTDPRGLISQAMPPREKLPGSAPVQPKESEDVR